MPAPKTEILIEPVARHFWGEPNERLSKANELRFGTNGSRSVDLDKLQWYDHEAQVGGSTLQLVKHVEGLSDRKGQYAWLRSNGFIGGEVTDIPARRKVPEVPKSPAKPVPDAKTPVTTPATKAVKAPKLEKITEYRYNDADGREVFRVVRFEPKTFRQARVVDGKLSWSVKGVKPVPYHLPQLLAAPDDALVFVVEGEKDVLSLEQHGQVATCNAGGAGKWTDAHAKHLKGRRVVILPDNDDAGRKHAEQVRKTLRDIATEVHVIELPGMPEKGDISDWLAAGGTADELLRLVAEARQKPAPAMPEIIGDDDVEGRKPAQTDLLVKYAKERFDLLHDKNGEAFARDQRTGEVRRMGSRSFRDRVTAGFFEDREVAVRDQSWREALGTLQALARFEGDPQEISIRVAGRDGRYWVDLCQPGNSRAVEIDANGWRVVERPPVLFVRSDSMQPLPEPLHGGDIAPLWSIANIPEEQRLLVLAWLLECMRPDTPYPGVELIGEQGSGKSTASEALRRVIDPNGCNLRGAPKTVEDIYVSAGQNLVVAYENVSHLHGGMQDALAVLSTGGGFAKRQLFTDADEHVISVRRPWLVNGISASVTQQDLVDRVISIECPVIAERESSSKQWQAFERDLPGILGGLYDLAVGALRELPGITLAREDRPRLVEFVLLGMAMTKHMGIDPAEFLRQFKVTRAETVARTLDASPVATALLDMLEAEPCGITASVKVILSNLERYKPLGADAWPRSAKGLGDALRRAAPALRQVGVECKCIGKSHGVITWSIRKARQESKSPMSTKSPDESNSGDMGTLGTSHPAETLVTEAL